MKNLLVVSHKMNLGGTEKALLSLLHEMKKNDISITLLLLEKGGVLEKYIPNFVNVKYFPDFDVIKPIIFDPPIKTILGAVKNFQFEKGFVSLWTYAKIKLTGDWFHNYETALKNHPQFGTFDVAIAFAGPSDFISYLVTKKIKAKKKIQWIHFDVEKVITNYNFGRKFYPLFDKIYCVSKSAKEIFVKHFPEVKEKTEVFENIVSRDELLSKANIGQSYDDGFSGIRILTVARFTKEKGHHLIPEAAKLLKERGLAFRWYLVGDGKQKAHVEHLVKQMSLENEVVFLGEQLNPYPYMKDCDIYVQPSLHEGFGITVAEAKIFCKPMVVTNFLNAKDLVADTVTGLIVDIDSTSIFEGIEMLISNPQLRSKLTLNLSQIQYEKCSDLQKLLQLL